MSEHQQAQQSVESKSTVHDQATPIFQTPITNQMAIIQRARINPKSLTPADVLQLQRTIGNRAVGRLLSGIRQTPSNTKQVSSIQRQEIPEEEPIQGKIIGTIQRQEIPEEEEPLQGMFAEPIQRQEIPEEEEPLQGRFVESIQRQEIPEEEEPLQGKFVESIQRQEIPEEEEPLQGKFVESIQRQEISEEEEPLQGKMAQTVQRQEIPEEEEPLQGKFVKPIQQQEIPEEEKCPSCVQRQETLEKEEPLQGRMIKTIQRQEIPEEEEPLQGMFENSGQEACPSCYSHSIHQEKENRTGMPDELKAGVENLSGIDMSDVRVHYNSDKPAEVGALAYTQGTDIHVAPGQERHLPHEAWHVVQQAEGRVKPTIQTKGEVKINDDAGLEDEATRMGSQAVQKNAQTKILKEKKQMKIDDSVIQDRNFNEFSFFIENNPEAILQKKVQPFNCDRSTRQLIQMNGIINGISEGASLNFISVGKLQMRDIVKANYNRLRIPSFSLLSKETIQRKPKTIAELEQLARYISPQEINSIINVGNPPCLTIGATHTGDMYHLKAVKSMPIYSKMNILIWGVNRVNYDGSVTKAFEISSYLKDKESTIYYSNSGKPTEKIAHKKDLEPAMTRGIGTGFWIDEGGATSLIMYTLKNDKLNRSIYTEKIKEGIAPIDKRDEIYERDLLQNGFNHESTYVLVNFRQSGHIGGTAPALDTGTRGYMQIFEIIGKNFPGVIAVPMGEYTPLEMRGPIGKLGPNLIDYWNWPCCDGNRKAQTGLLRYLNEKFKVIGAIGMRSGIIDSLAFSGIKILSIDINPSIQDDTSKGWERGNKLESVLSKIYGRAFIKNPRETKDDDGISEWEGEFREEDVKTIERSMKLFLSSKNPNGEFIRDSSHPLSKEALDKLIATYQFRRPSKPSEIKYIQDIIKQLRATYNFVPSRRPGPDYIDAITNLLPPQNRIF
jgi:Domain of unknown function (DUF4157)